MKKVLMVFICLLITGISESQINWLRNFDAAKSIAAKSKKLIVIDFWASWCGPCTRMDRELWNSPELDESAENFVALKIDVDGDKNTVSQYGVRGIPKVMIITSGGEVIWEKDGYDNIQSFLPVLKAIPGNVGDLNRKSLIAIESRKDYEANYLAGLEYQRVGKEIKERDLKDSFLSSSSRYFSRAGNLCKDKTRVLEIELAMVLNDVYNNHYQKALKQIEKMDPAPENESTEELRHFILALCYKGISDKENYQREKQLVKKPEFLAEL